MTTHFGLSEIEPRLRCPSCRKTLSLALVRLVTAERKPLQLVQCPNCRVILYAHPLPRISRG